MIGAYCFDLDGTLLDSEILWVDAVELLMRDRGFPFSRQDAVDLVYGNSWEYIYEDLGRRFPALLPEMDQFATLVKPYFVRLRDTRDIRIHGSIRLLKRLSREYPVCIVSGSYRDDIEEGLELMEVGRELAFYLGKEDYAPGKPHPACYRMAAERFGVAPERCLVFEDSTVGVEAAKGAGARCVALSRPGRPPQDLTRADGVLEDLEGYCPEMLNCSVRSRNDP
jgi:beta-phosphoglucomutase-like phosphatase (HAD superfamily)